MINMCLEVKIAEDNTTFLSRLFQRNVKAAQINFACILVYSPQQTFDCLPVIVEGLDKKTSKNNYCQLACHVFFFLQLFFKWQILVYGCARCLVFTASTNDQQQSLGGIPLPNSLSGAFNQAHQNKITFNVLLWLRTFLEKS